MAGQTDEVDASEMAMGIPPVTRSSDGALVSVEGLRKVFGAHRRRSRAPQEAVAVDNVTFDVKSGETLGIVGESGSGKTTIARMLVGLDYPTAGRILVDGVDRSDPPRGVHDRLRRAGQMQMVFQDPYTSLDPRQTVDACLTEVVARHHRGMSKQQRKQRIQELAEQVGLDTRQLAARPSQLSGGQRQRVAIARALSADPQAIVLDEAVSALDVSIQAQILNLLADLRASTNTAYIFISHDLAVIRQIADRIIVLEHGRIVESGATDSVLEAPQHEYTKRLRVSVPGPGWKPARTERSAAP